MKYVSNVWNCEWNRGRLGKKVQKHMYMSGPILYHFLLYKSLSLCCIISSSSHPKSFKNAPRSHIIRFRTFFLAPFDTFCFCIRGPWVSGPCNSEFLQRFYFLMIPVHQWSHNPSFVAVTEIFIGFIIYVILIIIITRPKLAFRLFQMIIRMMQPPPSLWFWSSLVVCKEDAPNNDQNQRDGGARIVANDH